MSTTSARKAALFLIVLLLTPSLLFMSPPKASAAGVSCLGGLAGLALGVADTVASIPVHSTSGNIINGSTAGSSLASCVTELVIVPLIRAAIRQLIQKLTSSVIKWINGGNGTGEASYVRDLSGHMRNLSDSQALTFIAQLTANSNSPFSGAITSSLYSKYQQNTSSRGFFVANRSTLPGASSDVNAYLSGNWSRGGVSTWFALTTQPENNPYMLYQASETQLGSLVSVAVSNRGVELAWGQGFLSWCGADGGEAGTTYPGEACKKKDGSPGKIQTPGSIIAGYANKAVVSTGFDQLVSANDLDGAFSAIISALLGQVLGGVNGLFGASSHTASGGNASSIADQLGSYGQSGASADQELADTLNQSISFQDILLETVGYKTTWDSLTSLTTTASTAVNKAAATCTALAASYYYAGVSGVPQAKADAARSALTNQITPLVAQAAAARTALATKQVAIDKVQSDLKNQTTTYATDLETLRNTPPSSDTVKSIQQEAQSTGSAIATPEGSLNVSGGTIVDRLNLLKTNADKINDDSCR